MLEVCSRQQNTLSAILRNACDTGDLRTLENNGPNLANGTRIAIVGHITPDEIRRRITATDNMANGLAKRFSWQRVKRSKLLPFGGSLDSATLNRLAMRFRDVMEFALGVDTLGQTNDVRNVWQATYPTLSAGKLEQEWAILDSNQ